MARKTASLEEHQPSPESSDSIAKTHNEVASGVARTRESGSSAIPDPAGNRKYAPIEGFFQQIIAVFTVILGLTAIVTNFQTCRALRDSRDNADRQWSEMHEQSRLIAKQISDAETIARASVVFFNTRIEDFPKHPVLKFTLKNVGQTTARAVTAGPKTGSQNWLKFEKNNPLAALGPGEGYNTRFLESLAKFTPPKETGFSLAQGEIRDFTWPMIDHVGMINTVKNRPKGMEPQPTFADVSKGLGSFYLEVYFTYLDASGHPRATADCLAHWGHEFVPCWGGHIEQ